MTVGLSDIREAKRALIIFCEENKLDLGDESALKAAQQLLRFAQQRPVTYDQLLLQLRSRSPDL